MAYFYVLLLTFLFSFGGIMIKSSGMMFSSFMISFLRFAIGVALLLIIDLVKYKRIRISFASGLILLGGAARSCRRPGRAASCLYRSGNWCRHLHHLPEDAPAPRYFCSANRFY